MDLLFSVVVMRGDGERDEIYEKKEEREKGKEKMRQERRRRKEGREGQLLLRRKVFWVAAAVE